MAIPLKSIIFPGNMRQPCEAEYGIHLYAENMIGKAHIVVIQSDKTHEIGTSLWNTDYGRNIVLNKILVSKGNRHDSREEPAENIAGVLKNLIGKGEKSISVWSVDVVGGSTQFYADFEQRKHLSGEELKGLLQAVGYVSDSLIV